jgi:hypothetical protein
MPPNGYPKNACATDYRSRTAPVMAIPIIFMQMTSPD